MKSLHHSFDIHLAEKYGVHEAILIHHFQYWISFNQKMKRNFLEERTWTYQTRAEILAHFPYMTDKMLRGALTRLEKQGVIIKGNFNKSRFDSTTWFAFQDESMFLNKCLRYDKRANGKLQKGQAIPDPIPHPPEEERVSPPTEEERLELDNRFKKSAKYRRRKVEVRSEWDKVTLKDIRADRELQANTASSELKAGLVFEENLCRAKNIILNQDPSSFCTFRLCENFLSASFKDGTAYTISFSDPEFENQVEKCKNRK